jgi:hypothetical protein
MGRTLAGLIIIAACLATVVGLVWMCSSVAGAQQPPLTVVVIQADDLSYRVYNELPRMPRLLDRRGLRLERHYVTQSTCCPSRATFVRGQYSHNHGVMASKAPYGWGTFGDRERDTLATRLDRAGWETVMVGKYMNGWDRRDPVPDGWDHFITRSGGSQIADFVRRRTTDLIPTLDRSRPWFLHLNPAEPHGGVPIADRYKDAPVPRDCVDLCPEMLRRSRALEDLVEETQEALEQAGRTNTYLIFTSDNGYMFGQHGRKMGKNLPYDSSSRVPTFVVGPGVPVGQVEYLTANIDWMPTILELAGLPAPSYVDGRSLVDILRGETPVKWRKRLLLENSPELRLLSLKAVVGETRLFIDWPNKPDALWDVPEERRQIRNEDLEPYRAHLRALKDCAGASCRAAED